MFAPLHLTNDTRTNLTISPRPAGILPGSLAGVAPVRGAACNKMHKPRVVIDEHSGRIHADIDPASPATKVLHRLLFSRESGCWQWTGPTVKGYAIITVSKNCNQRAHRIVFEALVGPIPSGLVIDHLCRNKACCNPEHLEPVTSRQNVLRGIGPTSINAQKTHCVKGHDFTPENTIRQATGRKCRKCHNEGQADYYRRRFGLKKATKP